MAGRGLGGHRVEEGVKEEPQDDPDGEAHQYPSQRQRHVGENHRGGTTEIPTKQRGRIGPSLCRQSNTTEVTRRSTMCTLATRPSPAPTQGRSNRESAPPPSYLRRSKGSQVRSPIPMRRVTRDTASCGSAMRSLASMPSRNGLARPTCSVSGARDRAWGDHGACTQQNPEVGCARFLPGRPVGWSPDTAAAAGAAPPRARPAASTAGLRPLRRR